MFNTLQAHKTGLSVGSFIGLCHLAWAILVVIGLAQPIIEVIMRLHMVKENVMVTPFSFTSAILLIIWGCVAGYVIGYVFSVIWNAFHK